MAKKQEIVFEKNEEISTKAEDKIREILTNEGVKSSIDVGFVEYEKKNGKITIESTDEKLLNEILTSIVGHYNDKQDNFSMITEGFKVDSE